MKVVQIVGKSGIQENFCDKFVRPAGRENFMIDIVLPRVYYPVDWIAPRSMSSADPGMSSDTEVNL